MRLQVVRSIAGSDASVFFRILPRYAAATAGWRLGAAAPCHDGAMASRLADDRQLRLPYQAPLAGGGRSVVVSVPGIPGGVVFVRQRRARHYILRLRDDGLVRVTVPWSGSRAEAERFLLERRGWIARQRHRHDLAAGRGRGPWRAGTMVAFSGNEEPLVVVPAGGRFRVSFGGQTLTVSPFDAANLRASVEGHLRRLASRELPARLGELARANGFTVVGVSIRNQRTRWGSCSPSGKISLNWRLVQVPPAVRDYVLLHELTHLRHLNHSARFWRELARLCPHHLEARRWLRSSKLLAC
jgi:predicted metal-dependent hydrolase